MEKLEARMEREYAESLREAGFVPAGAPAQAQTGQAQPPPVQAPAPQPPQAPAPAQAHPVPPPEETALLRHQIDTLRGKYNAEVPRLHAEIRSLSTQLVNKDALIEELRRQISGTPVQAASGGNGRMPPSFQQAFDSVRDEWGDKAAESFAAMAKAAAEAETAKVTQQVSQTVEPVKQSVEDLALQTYHDAISGSAGADWIVLNDDPGFVSWLTQNANPSGQTLKQALNEAYQSRNVPAVAFYFNTYRELLKRQPQVQPHTPTAPPPNGANAQPPMTPEQQAMLAAGGRHGDFQQQADSSGGRIFTEAEALRIYDDIGKGRYEHDPKTKRALEAELDRAYAEGRVLAR